LTKWKDNFDVVKLSPVIPLSKRPDPKRQGYRCEKTAEGAWVSTTLKAQEAPLRMSMPETLHDWDAEVQRGPWFTEQSGVDLSVVTRTVERAKNGIQGGEVTVIASIAQQFDH
jgi:hypothetical protein